MYCGKKNERTEKIFTVYFKKSYQKLGILMALRVIMNLIVELLKNVMNLKIFV